LVYEANKVLRPAFRKPYISYSSSGWIIERGLHQAETGGNKSSRRSLWEVRELCRGLREWKVRGRKPLLYGTRESGFKALRPAGAEYEKMILIDMESYVIIGFIDRYHETSLVWPTSI
jgi:hypothetical protein